MRDWGTATDGQKITCNSATIYPLQSKKQHDFKGETPTDSSLTRGHRVHGLLVSGPYWCLFKYTGHKQWKGFYENPWDWPKSAPDYEWPQIFDAALPEVHMISGFPGCRHRSHWCLAFMSPRAALMTEDNENERRINKKEKRPFERPLSPDGCLNVQGRLAGFHDWPRMHGYTFSHTWTREERRDLC